MKILFVDDEERRMVPVVEEFAEAGHSVIFISDVDSALEIIRDRDQNFDLVIMDISMPSGTELQTEDTDGGSRTGYLLFQILRKTRPTQRVVVYTNFGQRMRDLFASEDGRFFRFIRKPDILPFEFVEEMTKFVTSKDQSFKAT